MLAALRVFPGRPERDDLMRGYWAAEAIVLLGQSPREHYELARTWYEQTEALWPLVVEPALALYHLGRYDEALARLRRPERDAAAQVCAGLMTPVALLDLPPDPLPADEVRTVAIGLVLLRKGDAATARRLLAQARAVYAQRYYSEEWSYHSADNTRAFLIDAAKAIDGKK
jgi:tetratricopeptide (TPR) repeat protein